MDISKKHTVGTVNNHINLYKDKVEILEGILELYRSFFTLRDDQGIVRSFIFDYGIKIIEDYKNQWINLFNNILKSENYSINVGIKDISLEEFYCIIKQVEIVFINRYQMFLEQWNLEIDTFVERNIKDENISFSFINKFKENIENFTVEEINAMIQPIKNELDIEFNKLIEEFNNHMYCKFNKLSYFINNKTIMELRDFDDEISLVRELVLGMIDEFKEKIKLIIEDKLLNKILEKANKAITNKLSNIIMSYKDEINNLYILIMELEGEDTDYYNTKQLIHINKSIDEKILCRRFQKVLKSEKKYINFLRQIASECLKVYEEEAKSILNDMFNLEFYSGIFDLKFPNDIKNLIEGFKIKEEFILNSITLEILNGFINRFNEVVISMLKNRKYRIEKLYIFKPITYIGSFNIYEPYEVLYLENTLVDIYEKYDFKYNNNQELKGIKKAFISLNKEIEKLIVKFNFSLQSKVIDDLEIDSFNNKRIEIYNNITELQEEVWNELNSSIIKVFNSFNNMIMRSTKQLEVAIELYNINMD